jgi:hypothetical protein
MQQRKLRNSLQKALSEQAAEERSFRPSLGSGAHDLVFEGIKAMAIYGERGDEAR